MGTSWSVKIVPCDHYTRTLSARNFLASKIAYDGSVFVKNRTQPIKKGYHDTWSMMRG